MATTPVRPKLDAQIVVRLADDDKKDLKTAAARRDRSYNWLARDIIARWLAKERKRRRRS